jgi:hypothetical protein
MVMLGDEGIEDVGPRSAHIAGLPYAVYSDPEEIIEPEIVYIKPKKNDPDNYIAIKSKNGKMFAITVSCAANVLGYVRPEDYAYGNQEAARKALEPIAKKLNKTVEEVAKKIMDVASMKVIKVVKQIITDYKLDKSTVVLVGGGGGSAAIVPYVAEKMGMHYRIAQNAQVISPIGVALAMVREMVERTIQNPTEKDILSIRNEAREAVIKSGALEETVEVYVEIDLQKNIVRAIATGATELRSKDILNKNLGEEEIKKIVAQATKAESAKNLQIIDKTGSMYIIKDTENRKGFFGLLSQNQERVVVINKEGVIRLLKNNCKVYKTTIQNFEEDLSKALQQNISYGDGGAEIPDCFIILPNRIVDLSGVIDKEKIISLAKVEISGLSDNDRILILLSKR